MMRAEEALRALYEWYDRDGSVGGASDVFERYRGILDAAQTPAHLEELAQWADAAVELFPVHGEKFRQIAEVLRRLP